MTYNQLYRTIIEKGSFLTIGLDSDLSLIPKKFLGYQSPLFEFNRAIIDATHRYAVAYKPNIAFYEALGSRGWQQLEMTVEYIKKRDPSLFVIADAKRGDIGNTAERYAVAFFEEMGCDAVTLSPYMGRDSIEPFLRYKEKWAIILALTSNNSASDFETLSLQEGGDPLYKRVIERAMEWGSRENTIFVVGATRPEELSKIRSYCPDHFFLVPGIGAQGGSLEEVVKQGINRSCGLLVNSSRDIIYAWKRGERELPEEQFELAAARAAERVALQMKGVLQSESHIL